MSNEQRKASSSAHEEAFRGRKENGAHDTTSIPTSIITQRSANGTGSSLSGLDAEQIMQRVETTFFRRFVEHRRWVCWKYEPKKGFGYLPAKPEDRAKNQHYNKRPVNPHTGRFGSHTNRQDWGTLPQALARYTKDQTLDGIGFIFNGDGAVLIDPDDCRNPNTGAITPRVKALVDQLDCYTELSVSGTGLHCIPWADIPDSFRKKTDIEVYATARFAALTFDILPEYPSDELPDRTHVVRDLIEPESSVQVGKGEIAELLRGTGLELSADDEDVLEELKSRDPEFQSMWVGDWRSLPGVGNKSHSQADDVFLRKLCAVTQDQTQMARLYLLSGMGGNAREHANPLDYLNRSIASALRAGPPKKRGRPRKEQDPGLSREDAQWEVITLSTRKMLPTSWIWENRVMMHGISEFIGDPDLGKTTLAFGVIARVTTGGLMPDGTKSDLEGPADVLILSAEDDPERTIIPRLEAAGADLTRCHTLRIHHDRQGELILTIPDDIERLREVIRAHGIKLIVIDPIVAYLSDAIDSHKDASVRRALTPLAELSHEQGVAILCIRHMNKNSKEGNSKYRGGGSIAFTATVRVSHMVGKHGDTRVLACIKNNLGPQPKSLTYDIKTRVLEEVDGRPIVGSYVKWGGTIDLTADDLLSPPKDAQGDVLDRAKEVIYPLLTTGPVPVMEIQDAIENAGLSWNTVSTAKYRRRLGVESCRLEDDRGKKTVHAWKLPLQIAGLDDTDSQKDTPTKGGRNHGLLRPDRIYCIFTCLTFPACLPR